MNNAANSTAATQVVDDKKRKLRLSLSGAVVILVIIYLFSPSPKKLPGEPDYATERGFKTPPRILTLSTGWSESIPVSEIKGFNGEIVSGYASEILVRDPDNMNAIPIPIGPHSSGNVTSMRNFQLRINGEKFYQGPVQFRYWP